MPVRGELREHERLVGGKAEDGIADEYAGTYETDAGDDEQDRAKQAAPGMRREREPKPDSNQGNEGACNDKIHDLGPTEPSDRQGADRILHPVVLRSSKTFDQKCDDEERCAKGTKPRQKRLHEIPPEIRSALAPWRRRWGCNQWTPSASYTRRTLSSRPRISIVVVTINCGASARRSYASMTLTLPSEVSDRSRRLSHLVWTSRPSIFSLRPLAVSVRTRPLPSVRTMRSPSCVKTNDGEASRRRPRASRICACWGPPKRPASPAMTPPAGWPAGDSERTALSLASAFSLSSRFNRHLPERSGRCDSRSWAIPIVIAFAKTPTSAAIEQYRRVRICAPLDCPDNRCQALAVTSPGCMSVRGERF